MSFLLLRGYGGTPLPGVTPPQTVYVEVQVAFGAGVTDVLTEDDWTTLTGVKSVRVRRPSSRQLGELVRYSAGTCTIVLDNQHRRFDPSNLDGPYVSGGKTQLLPMTPVRIRVIAAGLTYPLWYGYADTWRSSYSKAAKMSDSTMYATDGTKVLARFNGLEQTAVGLGEAPGTRIGRILDNAGWPTALRRLLAGGDTLQATTLSRPAWEEILLTSDSCRGDVFFDQNGWLNFINREYKANSASSSANRHGNSQATWGDDDGELHYSDPEVSYDDTVIYNHVTFSIVGGTFQTAQDLPSQAQFGKSSLLRTDFLLQTDSAALAYANALVADLKDPALRIEGITYTPGSMAEQVAAAPVVFGVEMGDRWTVGLTPPGGGDRIIQDVWVAGMAWDFDHAGVSRAVFNFQPITGSGFALDHLTLGLLDSDVILAY
jgi:hypothetical protein